MADKWHLHWYGKLKRFDDYKARVIILESYHWTYNYPPLLYFIHWSRAPFIVYNSLRWQFWVQPITNTHAIWPFVAYFYQQCLWYQESYKALLIQCYQYQCHKECRNKISIKWSSVIVGTIERGFAAKFTTISRNLLVRILTVSEYRPCFLDTHIW